MAKPASIDISRLSLQELKELQKEIARCIKALEKQERKEALARVEQVAADAGISRRELVEHFGAGAKRPKVVKPKYRNSADPTQTWTGRGRKPRWLANALEEGKRLEDFEL